MERKVIFMTSIPFMEQHITDMYIKEISRQFKIEMWDLSKIYKCKDNVDNTYAESKKVNSLEELDSNLLNACAIDAVIVITNILNSYLGTIFETVKKHDLQICCINKESFNNWLFEQGAFKYRKYYNWKARLQAMAIHFPITEYALHQRQFGKYKYDYLLASQNYYKMQCKKFIKIHHIKYDESLAANRKNRTKQGKYLLFIDGGASSHPAYINRYNTLNHQTYLNKVNSYFDLIEEKFNLPVVISAHPKAMYKDNDFGGRPIYVGMTAELIHNCEAVVSHYSTSLINVVLENKPLQIIYYNEMLRSSFRGSMVMGLEFAELCGANICNLGSSCKWSMEINRSEYLNFLKNHVYNVEKMKDSNATLICREIEKIFDDEDSINVKK